MKKAELERKFDRFYKDTYQNALYYCMAKTGDFINSEDILADAYYSIYKRMKKMEENEIESPEQYLYAVLKNKVAAYWKKHRKELLATVSVDDEENYEPLLETEFNITEETATRKMLLQDILEFVSVQPAAIRRAFVIHFYLGKTLEETAEELDVSVSNVRNYIYRLLKKIKEEFMEEYE